MKVYVVLHTFLWDNPTEVVGVFTSKEDAIKNLIEDVHRFERFVEDESVNVTDRETIIDSLEYKEYFCLCESVWTIKESNLITK
jgi:hypothetical protein